MNLSTTYLNERQELDEVAKEYILKIWRKKTVSVG
jgi:hypothetical protein